jgi:peptidoglycan/LPS O-acetylase OafA/YrhL
LQRFGRDAERQAGASPGPSRFSHPELNSLRFLAFTLVFFRHAEPVKSNPGPLRDASAFGVHIFFLLSAYLIVSLLIRERQTTGTVNLHFFAIRRMLRIWPLYFLALAGGSLIGRIQPSIPVTRGMAAAFTLLGGNFYIAKHGWIGSPISVLWSLSVEEQFYLLVPSIAKFGGEQALRIACWVALFSSYFALILLGYRHANPQVAVWVNSFVCFQFFAAGGLIGIYMQGRRNAIGLPSRIGLGLLAMLLFIAAAKDGHLLEDMPSTAPILCIGYLMALAGCVGLFFAVLDYPAKQRSVPAYLGTISYGLYVFHGWCLYLLGLVCGRIVTLRQHRNLITDVLALILTIVLASLSYQFFERPVLRLKSRFEVV